MGIGGDTCGRWRWYLWEMEVVNGADLQGQAQAGLRIIFGNVLLALLPLVGPPPLCGPHPPAPSPFPPLLPPHRGPLYRAAATY